MHKLNASSWDESHDGQYQICPTGLFQLSKLQERARYETITDPTEAGTNYFAAVFSSDLLLNPLGNFIVFVDNSVVLLQLQGGSFDIVDCFHPGRTHQTGETGIDVSMTKLFFFHLEFMGSSFVEK